MSDSREQLMKCWLCTLRCDLMSHNDLQTSQCFNSAKQSQEASDSLNKWNVHKWAERRRFCVCSFIIQKEEHWHLDVSVKPGCLALVLNYSFVRFKLRNSAFQRKGCVVVHKSGRFSLRSYEYVNHFLEDVDMSGEQVLSSPLDTVCSLLIFCLEPGISAKKPLKVAVDTRWPIKASFDESASLLCDPETWSSVSGVSNTSASQVCKLCGFMLSLGSC